MGYIQVGVPKGLDWATAARLAAGKICWNKLNAKQRELAEQKIRDANPGAATPDDVYGGWTEWWGPELINVPIDLCTQLDALEEAAPSPAAAGAMSAEEQKTAKEAQAKAEADAKAAEEAKATAEEAAKAAEEAKATAEESAQAAEEAKAAAETARGEAVTRAEKCEKERPQVVELTLPLAKVKQGGREEIESFYASTAESAPIVKFETCEILKEFCNIGLLMEQDVNDEGKTVMKIKVGQDTQAGSYAVKIWDKASNTIFLATVVVEKKERQESVRREDKKEKKVVEKREEPVPVVKKERACGDDEMLTGVLGGKNPTKYDCKVINGKVTWIKK